MVGGRAGRSEAPHGVSGPVGGVLPPHALRRRGSRPGTGTPCGREVAGGPWPALSSRRGGTCPRP
ncbi:hypothetical protein FM117_05425 [Micrococcus luteus Mu201]|nr:hypothetical protein FM117_05425 [Micrococcus luteus Mu201]